MVGVGLSNQAGRVLVVGAINTDLVVSVRRAPSAGETITGQRFEIFGGGKGANQAVAASRSGAATAILGALGNDDFGRQRRADLQQEGIDVGDVYVSDEASSGVALIVVEESGENRIAYVPGATLTVARDQAVAAFERWSPAVVLSTLELPLQTVSALLDVAKAAGAVTIVNATPEPADGKEAAVNSDVLVVNETEAADLLGASKVGPPWPEVVEALATLGPRTVVITLGAAGAVVFHEGAFTELPAPEVNVVDTTGAGDAFCGAMAARLAAGDDPVTAAGVGVVAGAIAVTKAGAQPSMPTRDKIKALRGTL